MAFKKKLQVFVSSTYLDLVKERQAAVEAILTAGHIPAGMELFAAGDKSQMDVIKRWIDESDVYLLLLAGRYGSVDPDSGKSYTQLEYEYAIEKGKPYFALVITDNQLDEKVKVEGKQVLELEHQQQLKAFRALVTTKIVKFWNDSRDITIAILQKLPELERRADLIGWVPGDEAINSNTIAMELARLAGENSSLKSKEPFSASLSGALEKLERKKSQGSLAGIPSGFVNLDRLTLGWQAAELIILAAKPSMGKCLGKGTNVVMFDGTLRRVEDICVGDLLMGDDSCSRQVLSIARGREMMYWIRQEHGIDYRVNESHIISLKKREAGKNNEPEVLNISVRQYLSKTGEWKGKYKGYKVAIDFPTKAVFVDSYIFGFWMCDKHTNSSDHVSLFEPRVTAEMS